MCTAGGTVDVRVAFEGDPWLVGRMFFPYKGAVRHTPPEEVGTRNGGVGMMLRGGEGLDVDVTRHDLTLH
jgi:hypothetical protein